MNDIADLFCGAGGTSTGVLMAAQELGKDINLVAVNHWDLAIATHSENHPDMAHYNSDLSEIDPRKVVPSGKLRLLVASPECTHFSRARGGKPMSKQSRASIKYVLAWVNALDVEDVLIENVPEFMDWGPLHKKHSNGCDGNHETYKDATDYEEKRKVISACQFNKPIKNRKGEYFHRFINKMRKIGYAVEWRLLVAADYGDPTTRKRLFIIARKHQPIRFPEPTHHKDGGNMFGAIPRWRSAREIIDWSIKGESIFKRKQPLAENTLRRIWAGLMKYGGKAFVIGQQSGAVARSVEDPIPTIATAGKISFIEPYLVEYHGGEKSDRRTRPIDEPMPTLDTSNRFGLVEPFIMQMDQGGRLHDVDKPMPTLTSADGFAIVEPFLVTTNWQATNRSQPRSINDPVPTLIGHDSVALVEPFIIPFFGERAGQSPRTHSVNEPLPTVTSQGGGALVEPFLVEYYGTGQSSSVDEPMKTLTGRDRFALVEPLTFFHGGKKYLMDIRFRMLQPHELARAMSFPEGYHFKGTREQVVKQIGNAVPVSLAKQLAKTLLAEPGTVN